jgi:hypothetical protein
MGANRRLMGLTVVFKATIISSKLLCPVVIGACVPIDTESSKKILARIFL